MEAEQKIFVKNAVFFETFYPRRKPTLVSGRNFCSLSYRFKGKISISYGDTTLISQEDTVTFMPKGYSYTTEVFEDVHMATVHFDFDGDFFWSEPAVISADDPELKRLFMSLIKKDMSESCHFSSMATFYTLLGKLRKSQLLNKESTIPSKVAYARSIIEESYKNPYFSIEALSSMLGVSTAYLRREFGAYYGISPIRYLKEVRLEGAKKLLILTSDPISEVARLCGYAGISYFIQDFHKATGESPDRYRKRILFTP